MTFQHVLPLGPCIYLGHINTAPTCTTSLKLVLVFASNPLLLPLPSSLRGILIHKFFDIRTCIALGCQYNSLVVVRLTSSWSLIGGTSVSSWVLPTQEAGRKEYARAELASLTADGRQWIDVHHIWGGEQVLWWKQRWTEVHGQRW